MEIAGHALKIAGQALEIAGQALEIAGQALEIAGQALEIAGQALKIAGHTWPATFIAPPGQARLMFGFLGMKAEAIPHVSIIRPQSPA
jgi:hypothetical protein